MSARGRTLRAIADYWAGEPVKAVLARYGYHPDYHIAEAARERGFRRGDPVTRSHGWRRRRRKVRYA